MRISGLFAGLLLAGTLAAQVAGQANSGYQTEQQRKGVANGLADPARDEKQKPGELIRAMGLQPGMTVADVGTGIGYMLPFLSRARRARRPRDCRRYLRRLSGLRQTARRRTRSWPT